ncbi:hypothetical protein [Sinorhizobium fredii]|nr:hypothetical protein [Sinorhizobium fredii]
MEMHLVRTRFETLDESGNVQFVTYGARLYDDLECTYANTISNLEDLLNMNSDDLVDFMRSSSSAAHAMLFDTESIRFFVDGEIYSAD